MISTTLFTGLFLAALWVIGFFLYREYRVDVFRQQLFAVRDDLFDLARMGEITFDHPAYCSLRTMCNGYIRFGHRFNVLTVVLLATTLKSAEKAWVETQDFDEHFRQAISDLDVGVRERVLALKDRLQQRVVSQLIFGSPVLVATVVPAAMFAAIVWFQVERVRAAWARYGDPVDLAAHRLGMAN